MNKAMVVLALAGAAFGQEMVVVGDDVGIVGPAGEDIITALFWNDFISAGPSATNQEDDTLDLWIVEDFELSQAVALTKFESRGWITSGATGGVTDVTVRIYDGPPWEDGQIVVESIEGEGWMSDDPSWGTFHSVFAEDVLNPGSYMAAYQASRAAPNIGIAVFFAAPGEYDVGVGTPDEAFQWNPGGGFGYRNNVRKVPIDLKGNGCIGVNFTLKGVEASCAADFNGDGVLNVLDFVAFQLAWQDEDPGADCNGDGGFDVLDFVCFQQTFVGGC